MAWGRKGGRRRLVLLFRIKSVDIVPVFESPVFLSHLAEGLGVLLTFNHDINRIDPVWNLSWSRHDGSGLVASPTIHRRLFTSITVDMNHRNPFGCAFGGYPPCDGLPFLLFNLVAIVVCTTSEAACRHSSIMLGLEVVLSLRFLLSFLMSVLLGGGHHPPRPLVLGGIR